MASHIYSFSLKLHVIRNIITTPYSFPPKHYFSLPCSALIGTGHKEVVLRGWGRPRMRARGEARRWQGGWSPPFVALASLEVQKQKSRGRSGN